MEIEVDKVYWIHALTFANVAEFDWLAVDKDTVIL